MKIVVLYIKDFFRRIMRHLYWLFRLSRAKIGKNPQVRFPVRVEGKGKLIIGNNCQIGKNIYFALGEGGEIIIGNNCRIDENVELIVGKGGKIIIGNNAWIMRNTQIACRKNTFRFGDDVVIAQNVQIFSREQEAEGNLSVGNGTHINDFAILDITGDLSIGEEVAFGQYSIVFTHDHLYNDLNKAAWKGGLKTGNVAINDRSWIGAHSVILPDVIIGYRTVIASGAVVTKDCPDETICAGVPAKMIKRIDKNA